MNGDQFRQSKSSSISSSPLTSVPPRDAVGAQRYTQHLPFQVFCCESGTHVVDPAQSYYAGISYRSGTDYHNASTPAGPPVRAPDAKCLDSTQAWFCRDLWVHKAKEGMRALAVQVDEAANGKMDVFPNQRNNVQKREPQVEEAAAAAVEGDKGGLFGGILGYEEDEEAAIPEADQLEARQGAVAQPQEDLDANVGSDYDASDLPADPPPPPTEEEEGGMGRMTVPNQVFKPAKIMVNPRCVTTYAGVSHTQLALDLFGPPDGDDDDEDEGEEEESAGGRGKRREGGKDVLEKWEGAPETFVCQEQQ